MCDLYARMWQERFIGYKVVTTYANNKKRYSAAMGFCYDDYEEIPIIKRQRRLSMNFISDILDKNQSAYSPSMEGRTAVFVNLEDAIGLYRSIENHRTNANIHTEIYKAEVSKDLMKGNYGHDEVVAGRKIKFLKRI